MDPVTYLTTFDPTFGALEWVFLVAQIALAVAGAYLALLRVEPHPIRRLASRNFGYALLGVGALGIVLGALRLAPVQIFTMPIWFTIVTVLEILLAAYALYYTLSVLPGRVAAYDETNRGKSARRSVARPQPALQTNGAHGTSSFSEPRQAATTTRRDARRDRKRKSR